MPSPYLASAEAVRDLLNGEDWGPDYDFEAAATRFPKYKRESLRDLTVVCVPALADENSISPLDRGSFNVECPVNVVVAQLVDRADVTRIQQLEDLLYDMGELIAQTSLGAYARPTEDVVFAWDEEEWQENGLFYGRVGVVYEYRQLRV